MEFFLLKYFFTAAAFQIKLVQTKKLLLIFSQISKKVAVP